MQRAILCISLLGVALAVPAPTPLGAELLRFEGDLFAEGRPAEGAFDFRFRLLDGAEAATALELAEPIELQEVQVDQGRFRVELEFDVELPEGLPLWLAVEVAKPGSRDDFTALEPAHPVIGRSELVPEDNFPAGTVVYFDLAACPAGWTELTAARGRTIVGLPSGGTLGGTQGTALTNLEARTHDHGLVGEAISSATGSHNHAWASITFAGSDVQWTSFDAAGNAILVFNWTNGIDEEGSGIYPLSAHPNETFYTNLAGYHSHTLNLSTLYTTLNAGTLPYLQLRACRKD